MQMENAPPAIDLLLIRMSREAPAHAGLPDSFADCRKHVQVWRRTCGCGTGANFPTFFNNVRYARRGDDLIDAPTGFWRCFHIRSATQPQFGVSLNE